MGGHADTFAFALVFSSIEEQPPPCSNSQREPEGKSMRRKTSSPHCQSQRPSSVSVAVLETHSARKRSPRSAHSFSNRVRHLLVQHLQRNLKKVQQRQRSNAKERVRMGSVPHQRCLQVVAQAILTRRPSWPGPPMSVLESSYSHPAPRPK